MQLLSQLSVTIVRLIAMIFAVAALSSTCFGSTESAPDAAPLRIVATPNPNVFPLLLAMSRNPDLPVRLVPVATGSDAVDVFSAGKADALLSMTYAAAQDVVTHQIPQLQLVEVDFWRGFWMLAPQSANISRFSQLAAQGVLVSGPTSGGKGGGPDLIFQAAIKRANMSPANFRLCYLAVMQAAPIMTRQQPMNSNAACASGLNVAPAAISMVEPAASGMVMDSHMSPGSTTLAKAIDMQTLFTGYTSWPANQLPHGGVSVLKSVLDSPSRLAVTQTVLKAYRDAADRIMAAKGHPFAMMSIAHAISAGIATYYGQYGMSLPGPVLIASLRSGDLIYRTDLPLPAIQPDLSAFLAEVVGTSPPAAFYRPLE
ncbi:MAG: substrate-binding domain-containing protein [Burkholderiales bacterium]